MLTDENRKEISKYLDQHLPAQGTARLITFGTTRSRAECMYCDEVRQLSEELAELSGGRIVHAHHAIEEAAELARDLKVRRAPATVVADPAGRYALKFYGLPGGYEFTALLEDVIDVATGSTRLAARTVEALQGIGAPAHIQVFVTPTCPYCPRAVRTAHQFSVSNPQKIDAEMVESMEFPMLADEYSVMAVPKVVVNGRVEFEGALPEAEFLAQVLEASRTTSPEAPSRARGGP